jgi:DNA-binding response OmpR family regulator
MDSVRKVLVADDNVDCLEVLQQYLSLFDYEVFVAEDGLIALQRAYAVTDLPPFYVPAVIRVFPKRGSPRAPLLRRCRRRSHSPARPATIAAEQRERACCSRA